MRSIHVALGVACALGAGAAASAQTADVRDRPGFHQRALGRLSRPDPDRPLEPPREGRLAPGFAYKYPPRIDPPPGYTVRSLPEPVDEPWTAPNLVDLKHRGMAARLGFGARMQGILRGEPLPGDSLEAGQIDGGVGRADRDRPWRPFAGAPRRRARPGAAVDRPTFDDAYDAEDEALDRDDGGIAQGGFFIAGGARGPGDAPAEDAHDFGPPDAGPEPDSEADDPDADLREPADLGEWGAGFGDPDATGADAAPMELDELEDLLDRVDAAPTTELLQRLEVGLLDSDFTSTADGATSTNSRYVRHLLEWRRGLGPREDLTVVQDLTVDVLRIREALDARFTRHVEREGRLRAEVGGLIQDSKEGEIEPDHTVWSAAFGGGRESEEGLSWEARVFGRGQDYRDADEFYLDSDRYGAEALGSYSIHDIDLAGRHLVERERYPDGPTNDVDRVLSEFSLTARPARGVETTYYSSYFHDRVPNPGDLDPYRGWTGDLGVTWRAAPRLTAEFGFNKYSQTVDTVSEFLFDHVAFTRRYAARYDLTAALQAGLSYETGRVRNRRSSPLIPAELDDRDSKDWTLDLTWTRGEAQAGLVAYMGDSRYIRGQSEAFADYDRRGLSVQASAPVGRRVRAEANHSYDRESYPQFPINDNRAVSTEVRLSYDF